MVLEWEEYFMELAKLTAKRSKDPVTQVGAVIINKNKRVIGTEIYNVTKSGNFCVNFFDLNDDVYFYNFS